MFKADLNNAWLGELINKLKKERIHKVNLLKRMTTCRLNLAIETTTINDSYVRFVRDDDRFYLLGGAIVKLVRTRA